MDDENADINIEVDLANEEGKITISNLCKKIPMWRDDESKFVLKKFKKFILKISIRCYG
jgi:hypothetical protein